MESQRRRLGIGIIDRIADARFVLKARGAPVAVDVEKQGNFKVRSFVAGAFRRLPYVVGRQGNFVGKVYGFILTAAVVVDPAAPQCPKARPVQAFASALSRRSQ